MHGHGRAPTSEVLCRDVSVTSVVPRPGEHVDDRPAACSPIEPEEFGHCRAIIGWGIDPGTGLCAGISGCGCDERCEGRIFPDQKTCQRECHPRVRGKTGRE